MTLEVEEEDGHGDKNVGNDTEASGVIQSLLCFLMTKKDSLDHVLDGSESLQEFTKKSLLKTGCTKSNCDCSIEVNVFSLSAFCLHVRNHHLEIF